MTTMHLDADAREFIESSSPGILTDGFSMRKHPRARNVWMLTTKDLFVYEVEYLNREAVNGDGVTISFYEIVDEPGYGIHGPRGPLVSRRFVDRNEFWDDWFKTVMVPSGKDWTVDDIVAAQSEPWADLLWATVGQMVRSLGADQGIDVRGMIDGVWVDDREAQTIIDLHDRITVAFGRDVSTASIKTALQRGPFRSDRGRPARWSRRMR